MKFNITIKDGTFVYYKSKWKSWYKITLSEKCAVLCCSVVSDSLRLHELYPALYSMDSLLSPCDSSGKNWSELPFSSPGDPPDPGMDPGSPALQANSLPSEPLGKSKWKPAWAQIFWILTIDMWKKIPQQQ